VSPKDDDACEVRDRKLLSRLPRGGVATAVIGAAALALPSSCFALDITSLSGGAGALASTTTSILKSLAETGFYQAFTLVFLSEIGDKTFFIAGLLAARFGSRFIAYAGSMGALTAMTILSVIIGQIFHAVPSGLASRFPIDDVAAVLAFTFFGLKTLKDAFDMEEGESAMEEELQEAEETVEGSNTAKQATGWYVWRQYYSYGL
jgi:hypothetical protein